MKNMKSMKVLFTLALGSMIVSCNIDGLTSSSLEDSNNSLSSEIVSSSLNSSVEDNSSEIENSSSEIVSSSLNSSVEDSSSEIELPITAQFIDAKKSPEYPQISEDIIYTTYYIDSATGSDTNDGLSLENPKQSLTAAAGIIRSTKENTPTKVLFKAGSEYTGKFTIEQFMAKDESPLFVGVYGETDSVKYAKITGNNSDNCIEIKAGNIRLSNFECTAPLGHRGIHVTTQKKGAMKNIVVSNCYIHDVNFDQSEVSIPLDGTMPDATSVQKICPDGRFSYNCGGIIFEADTPLAKGASWYENVWIDDNIIERVTRTGIWVFSNWAQRPGVDWGRNPYYNDEINWFHHTNVNIRRNDILFSGGDGIILGVTVDAFIEGNYCYNAQILGRPNYYCAGIWSHSCKNIVFQFNEASYTHTARDGQGFDIDIGNSDVLFQYNYSHHNDGGGLLCCNTKTNLVKYDIDGEMQLDDDGLPVIETIMAPWHDTIVKNNVFADNKTADFILSGTVNDVMFDNNTVIKAGIIANERVIDTKDFYTGIPGDRWTFSNNIFYMRKTNTSRFELGFSKTFEFKNNIYYGFLDNMEETLKELGETKYVSNINPKFVSTEATDGFKSVFNFIPTEVNVLTGGETLSQMLKYDLCGNDVTNLQNYYGAFATNEKENA